MMQMCEISDLLQQPFALSLFLFSYQAADFKSPLSLKQHFIGEKTQYFLFFLLASLFILLIDTPKMNLWGRQIIGIFRVRIVHFPLNMKPIMLNCEYSRIHLAGAWKRK